MAKKCSVVLRSNAYVVGTSPGNIGTSGVSSLLMLKEAFGNSLHRVASLEEMLNC